MLHGDLDALRATNITGKLPCHVPTGAWSWSLNRRMGRGPHGDVARRVQAQRLAEAGRHVREPLCQVAQRHAAAAKGVHLLHDMRPRSAGSQRGVKRSSLPAHTRIHQTRHQTRSTDGISRGLSALALTCLLEQDAPAAVWPACPGCC